MMAVYVQTLVLLSGVCVCVCPYRQITDRLIMSAMMRSVLMFNGNLGNSLWLMALGGPLGRCVSVMLNKNIYTEVSTSRGSKSDADRCTALKLNIYWYFVL